MKPLSALGVAVVASVALAACGGGGPTSTPTPSPTPTSAPSPTPTPTATPTPEPALSACEAVPALPTTFTDQANLYSISLPDGWAVVTDEGPVAVQVSRMFVQSPDFSVFVDEAQEGPFTPIYYETGAQFAIHATNIERSPPYHFGPVISESEVAIDGTAALYHVFKEPSTYGGQHLDAHLNHGGNHYDFLLNYNPETCPAGEGLFQAMLDSFQLQ